MRIQLTVRRAGSAVPARVVVVECAPGTRAGELARALGAPGLSVAGRPVPDTALVGMPPLLRGAVVQLGGPPTASPTASPTVSPWELRVLDGPDVGLRVPLPFGQSLLGRADDTTVVLTDPRASRRHAELDVRRGSEITVRDVGGTNGTWVGGARVDGSPRSLSEGDVLEIGSTRLQVRMSPRAGGGLQPDGGGHLLVPSTDAKSPVEPECVRFPDAPGQRPRMRFPLVALMVPLILAGVLAAVMRSPTMLLFGLTGPVLSFATWIGERRHRSGAVSDAERRAAFEEASAALDHALLRERQRLERSHPPLAEVLAVAETRSSPLWRGRGAEVRLGVGRRPSQVVLDGESAPAPMWLQDVPVTVDLAEVGALGVCGERGVTMSSVAAVVARLAIAVPPSRIELLVVVAEPTRVGDWDFAGWLPQTQAVAMAGEAGPHLDRLLAEIARREDADRVRAPPERSLVVVVVDGWPVARVAAALDSVVRRGPSVGVVAVVLATSRAQLPRCGAVLTLASDRANLSSEDGPSCALVPDQPGRSWVDRMSRALAPLRELSGVAVGARTDLPVSVRLLDLVGGVDAASVAACWQRRSASTRAVIGVTSTGTLAVDLAVDGPHALIAGTTGAGKSELLQTLVCSLALANRPDEMTFLLVDYKGGAAFRDCARLPHVVGVVTDLDGPLTARALTSLTAELRRRERLFADAGAGDMDEYRRARVRDADLPAVSRLVIAIDEFRVLAEELPDFVHGLVRLAAVGRSLGVHLVLATQRPGGIVSADIRANVSLRIALRVRDRTDSVDVLDDPGAASIDATTPGRATLRGAATPLTRFQSARVTATAGPVQRLTVTPLDRGWSDRPEGDAAAHSRAAARTDPTGLTDPTDPSDPAGVVETEPGLRDLDRIVDAVRGATTILGIAEPPSPWLPPLPDRLDVRSLGSAVNLESVPLGAGGHPGRAEPNALVLVDRRRSPGDRRRWTERSDLHRPDDRRPAGQGPTIEPTPPVCDRSAVVVGPGGSASCRGRRRCRRCGPHPSGARPARRPQDRPKDRVRIRAESGPDGAGTPGPARRRVGTPRRARARVLGRGPAGPARDLERFGTASGRHRRPRGVGGSARRASRSAPRARSGRPGRAGPRRDPDPRRPWPSASRARTGRENPSRGPGRLARARSRVGPWRTSRPGCRAHWATAHQRGSADCRRPSRCRWRATDDGVIVVGVRDGDLEPVGFSPATGERRILVSVPPGRAGPVPW